MTQEVLKLSQEALAGLKDVEKQVRELVAENKALKEALAKEKTLQALHDENERLGLYKDAYAQPEQEPVATVAEVHMSRYTIEWTNGPLPEGSKLYSKPPQRTWVDVPDEEIKILWIQYRAALPRYLCFAKALLARAKEKNT